MYDKVLLNMSKINWVMVAFMAIVTHSLFSTIGYADALMAVACIGYAGYKEHLAPKPVKDSEELAKRIGGIESKLLAMGLVKSFQNTAPKK